MTENIIGFGLFLYYVFGLGIAAGAVRDGSEDPPTKDDIGGYLLIIAVLGIIWPSVFGYKFYKRYS